MSDLREAAQLEINKTYNVISNRKGKFTGKLLEYSEDWATLCIVAGKADALLEENKKYPGELVIVRRSFCKFTEVPNG